MLWVQSTKHNVVYITSMCAMLYTVNKTKKNTFVPVSLWKVCISTKRIKDPSSQTFQEGWQIMTYFLYIYITSMCAMLYTSSKKNPCISLQTGHDVLYITSMHKPFMGFSKNVKKIPCISPWTNHDVHISIWTVKGIVGWTVCMKLCWNFRKYMVTVVIWNNFSSHRKNMYMKYEK